MDTPATNPRPRWPQFYLRTGFIALTASSVLLAAILAWWNCVERETRVAQELQARGASVGTNSYRPTGFFKFFLPDQIVYIGEVGLEGPTFTDHDLALLAPCQRLQRVTLYNTSITLGAAEQFFQNRPHLVDAIIPSPDLTSCYFSNSTTAEDLVRSSLQTQEELLAWRLALARLHGDSLADQRAYEHCVARLQAILDTVRPSQPDLYLSMLECAIARTQLQLAQRQGHRSQQLQSVQDCEKLARQLPHEAWRSWRREVAALADFRQVAKQTDALHVLLAIRLGREVRAAAAELRGDQPAQLQAVEDSLAQLDMLLQQIAIDKNSHPEQASPWLASCVASARLAADAERIRIAGEAVSYSYDATLVRRISQIHAELNEPAIDTLMFVFENSCRLMADVERRHPELSQRESFERDYERLLSQRGLGQDFSMLICVPVSVGTTVFRCAYLRYRLKREGEPLLQTKQHELFAPLNSALVISRPTPQPSATPAVDWLKEFHAELRAPLAMRP